MASTSNEYLVQAIGNKGELFDQPYQKLFHRTITATEVYLAWLVGNIADVERTKLLNGIKNDENAGLLAVTSNYWIVYATFKVLDKVTKRTSSQITLPKMKTAEFQNALRKHVEKGAELFYDAAIDTYDRADYGSFKSTLRATKFLTKMDSKLNARVAKLQPKALPDLVNVCKSIKVAA